MKRCTRCGEAKPLSEFYTYIKRGASGEHTYPMPACGVCHDALNRQWRQANRERYLAYQREYNRRRKAKRAGHDQMVRRVEYARAATFASETPTSG